jgi:AcrR family transcriptional regulator
MVRKAKGTARAVPRVRRAHAERSAATRRKIIASAIRLLMQRGYDETSLQNIARGARVTLGAIQHQFGTRDGLMLAVLEEVFVQMLGDSLWSALPEPLPERAREFVRRAWDMVYGQPRFLASWELIFGCKSSDALFARINAWRRDGRRPEDARFFTAFPEIAAQGAPMEAFGQFFWSSLRGIALLKLFDEPERGLENQLEVLADSIVRAAAAPDASRPRSSQKADQRG